MIRVGIPRALLYYQYYPMWKTFFEALGAEVIVSPATTQTMLANGSSRVVADTCLPVKVFLGHVLNLARECDYIFIPAIRSVKKRVYNCSKFLGLPDMTRAVIPEAPPILDSEIDINAPSRTLYQTIYQLGRHFTWNPIKIKQAATAAWQAHQDYYQLMAQHSLTPPQAMAVLTDKTMTQPQSLTDAPPNSQTEVAVIGHPYMLYDEHVNHRLITKLRNYGIKVFIPEMVTTAELEMYTDQLVGSAYWTYEHEVVGAGGYYLDSRVDGVIGAMAFGCGPDSLMMDIVRRQANRKREHAFMCLTLEEHTAEAGLVTRLEAFLDMITRKKRRRQELCV